jgi:hypothetical protein
LDVIFGDTSAVLVHSAEVKLGRCIALLGGLAIPLHRFDVVLGDT